jgi:hypothetical protein
MNSNNQRMILLLVICIATLANSNCGGIAQPTSSSTVPVATKTPSPKPTVTKTPTPDDVATTHFIETASINAIVATVHPAVLASYPSSDGKWRVDIIRYDCINYTFPDYVGSVAYEQLKIVNLADGTDKIVEDQLLNCDGIGAFGLDGLYWSPSNRYFYYSDWREGTPDGGCGSYLALPIYRLDTVTQDITTIGGSHISPDQTKLAFWHKNEIVIWDLDMGEIERIQGLVPNAFNGAIAWSPDGRSLTYLQSTYDYCAPDYGTTYFTRLDLVDMSQTLLLKFESPGFGGVRWETSDEIILTDGEGKLWIYDLISRELAPALTTTTPVPPGTFALKFYPPLIMEYDTSEWTDESRYEDTRFMGNYLQTNKIETSCSIGVRGPTDFNGTPPVFVPVQLGDISYSVIFRENTQPGDKSAWYIENQSLIGYDYSPGLPILTVQASASDWDRCQPLAEEVLATLRVP